MDYVPDAPWIGMCKEEWDERCRLPGLDYEDEEELDDEEEEEEEE